MYIVMYPVPRILHPNKLPPGEQQRGWKFHTELPLWLYPDSLYAIALSTRIIEERESIEIFLYMSLIMRRYRCADLHSCSSVVDRNLKK